MTTRTLREVFDQGDLNKLGSAAKVQALGATLNLSPVTAILPVVAGVATLPAAAKAAQVLEAWDRTNGAYLAVTAPEGGAATGKIAVSPTGDLDVDNTCASVEVVYIPAEGVVVTETVQVTGSAASFLGGKTSRRLLAASVVTGVAPGPLTVVARASVPAATEVSLDADGAGVTFNAGDVVNGTATLTYIANPSVFANDRLNGSVQF